MSEISYFQRYSQRENHITNTVLLMMRMLYREHPEKLQMVLEGIFTEHDEDLEGPTVGPIFKQQVGMGSSVPDGVISQESFNLIIEVKPGDKWNEGQLKRHIKSAAKANRQNTILLLLSTDVAPKFTPSLVRKAEENKIRLLSTTFDKIVNAIEQEGVVAAHETDLRDVVDDFKDVLSAEDLLEDPYTMFAFGCSQTLNWNLKHNIYYDYVERPSKAHVLTGFYANKKIHALGKVTATVIGNLKTGLKVETPHESRTSKQLLSLVKSAAKEMPTDDFSEPLRWYIYDELHETNFKKSTPYGYYQGVWFYLGAYTDDDYEYTDVAGLAHVLKGQSFGNDRGWEG